MSETRGHVGQVLYRVFRRDVGRKLIALFLAVLLFSAIDKDGNDVIIPGLCGQAAGWRLPATRSAPAAAAAAAHTLLASTL